MQVIDPSNLPLPQYKDLKSRHTLTDLLTEQIDLNEELSSENSLLASQQRKLISLLTQKDGQISKYRSQLSAPDITSRSLAARHIQLTLLHHLWKRLSINSVSQPFERLKKLCWTKSSQTSADSFVQKLAENLWTIQKSKTLKFLMIAGLNMRRSLENRGLKVYNLLEHLAHKRLSYAVVKIREYTIILQANKDRRIAGALLINSALHNRIYLNLTDFGLHRIKERSRTVNKGLEVMCQRLCDAVNKAELGAKREVFSRIRLKPYEDAVQNTMNVGIVSKKFIAIQLFFFQMSKFRQNLLWSGFASLQNARTKTIERIDTMVHALERNLGDINLQKDAFLKIKVYNFVKQTKETNVKVRLQALNRITQEAWLRELVYAFEKIKERKAFIFPEIQITKRKKASEKRKIGDLSSSEENIGTATDGWNKRRKYDQGRRTRLPMKVVHNRLKKTITETSRRYTIQMTNCIAMSRAKLMNFQQLNERILIESKEAIKKRQESEMELEAERKKVREMNKKVEELVKSSQQTMERRAQINTELTQTSRQLGEAEEKIKGYERKCSRLMQTVEQLEEDKAQLISKIEEVMETLEVMQVEYQSNKEELRQSQEQQQIITEELQEKNREVNILKERYKQIEDEFMIIKKQAEKKLSASQGEKLSGDIKDLRNQITKLKKENTAVNTKLEDANLHNTRLKTSNTELTKEAIQLNEEKNALKLQVVSLKDVNAALKRDMSMFENRFQKAMHDVEEEKARLMQKIMNEKTTPDYINQILDEKKRIENDNWALKQKIEKLHAIINSYDSNIVKQTDELINLQKETHTLRDERLSARSELKDLNDSVANLNRDKVNLMREMTLINDRNVKLERDAEKYRDVIDELQVEVQNYQVQMDMYVKVLKTMEDKMNRLDSKAKLTMSMSSNAGSIGPVNSQHPTQSTQRDNVDLDDDELINRLKSIRNKVETTHLG